MTAIKTVAGVHSHGPLATSSSRNRESDHTRRHERGHTALRQAPTNEFEGLSSQEIVQELRGQIKSAKGSRIAPVFGGGLQEPVDMDTSEGEGERPEAASRTMGQKSTKSGRHDPRPSPQQNAPLLSRQGSVTEANAMTSQVKGPAVSSPGMTGRKGSSLKADGSTKPKGEGKEAQQEKPPKTHQVVHIPIMERDPDTDNEVVHTKAEQDAIERTKNLTVLADLQKKVAVIERKRQDELAAKLHAELEEDKRVEEEKKKQEEEEEARLLLAEEKRSEYHDLLNMEGEADDEEHESEQEKIDRRTREVLESVYKPEDPEEKKGVEVAKKKKNNPLLPFVKPENYLQNMHPPAQSSDLDFRRDAELPERVLKKINDIVASPDETFKKNFPFVYSLSIKDRNKKVLGITVVGFKLANRILERLKDHLERRNDLFLQEVPHVRHPRYSTSRTVWNQRYFAWLEPLNVENNETIRSRFLEHITAVQNVHIRIRKVFSGEDEPVGYMAPQLAAPAVDPDSLAGMELTIEKTYLEEAILTSKVDTYEPEKIKGYELVRSGELRAQRTILEAFREFSNTEIKERYSAEALEVVEQIRAEHHKAAKAVEGVRLSNLGMSKTGESRGKFPTKDRHSITTALQNWELAQDIKKTETQKQLLILYEKKKSEWRIRETQLGQRMKTELKRLQITYLREPKPTKSQTESKRLGTMDMMYQSTTMQTNKELYDEKVNEVLERYKKLREDDQLDDARKVVDKFDWNTRIYWLNEEYLALVKLRTQGQQKLKKKLRLERVKERNEEKRKELDVKKSFITKGKTSARLREKHRLAEAAEEAKRAAQLKAEESEEEEPEATSVVVKLAPFELSYGGKALGPTKFEILNLPDPKAFVKNYGMMVKANLEDIFVDSKDFLEVTVRAPLRGETIFFDDDDEIDWTFGEKKNNQIRKKFSYNGTDLARERREEQRLNKIVGRMALIYRHATDEIIVGQDLVELRMATQLELTRKKADSKASQAAAVRKRAAEEEKAKMRKQETPSQTKAREAAEAETLAKQEERKRLADIEAQKKAVANRKRKNKNISHLELLFNIKEFDPPVGKPLRNGVTKEMYNSLVDVVLNVVTTDVSFAMHFVPLEVHYQMLNGFQEQPPFNPRHTYYVHFKAAAPIVDETHAVTPAGDQSNKENIEKSAVETALAKTGNKQNKILAANRPNTAAEKNKQKRVEEETSGGAQRKNDPAAEVNIPKKEVRIMIEGLDFNRISNATFSNMVKKIRESLELGEVTWEYFFRQPSLPAQLQPDIPGPGYKEELLDLRFELEAVATNPQSYTILQIAKRTTNMASNDIRKMRHIILDSVKTAYSFHTPVLTARGRDTVYEDEVGHTIYKVVRRPVVVPNQEPKPPPKLNRPKTSHNIRPYSSKAIRTATPKGTVFQP
eukprot:Platyproteum_vivax@DN7235_c0_g1_i1.p1